jgi:hypothetical protein
MLYDRTQFQYMVLGLKRLIEKFTIPAYRYRCAHPRQRAKYMLLRYNDDNAEGEYVVFALNFSLELKN